MTKQAYDKISGGLKEALELAKAPSMSQFDLATVEALADAWASIDGKQAEFRSGKSAKVVLDEHGGYYSGYLADAHELMKRLLDRGFIVTPTGG